MSKKKKQSKKSKSNEHFYHFLPKIINVILDLLRYPPPFIDLAFFLTIHLKVDHLCCFCYIAVGTSHSNLFSMCTLFCIHLVFLNLQVIKDKSGCVVNN